MIRLEDVDLGTEVCVTNENAKRPRDYILFRTLPMIILCLLGLFTDTSPKGQKVVAMTSVLFQLDKILMKAVFWGLDAKVGV